MNVAPENDLVAIGQLAAQLRRSVRDIEAACCELNVLPAKRINFVIYLDGNAIERLTRRLADTSRPLPQFIDAGACLPELRRP